MGFQTREVGNRGLVQGNQTLVQVMARAAQRVDDLANQAVAQAQSTPMLTPQQADQATTSLDAARRNIDFMTSSISPTRSSPMSVDPTPQRYQTPYPLTDEMSITPVGVQRTHTFSPPEDDEATPRRRTGNTRFDDQRSPLNRVVPETPEPRETPTAVPETPRRSPIQTLLATARKNVTEAANAIIQRTFPGASPRTSRDKNAPRMRLTDDVRRQIQAEQARRFREDDNGGDMSPRGKRSRPS